jgi:hypothetical protein
VRYGVRCLGFGVWAFEISGPEYGVEGCGLKFWGLGSRTPNLGLRVQDLVRGVWGVGFRVHNLGLRVEG